MDRILVPAALPHLLRAVHAALVEHRDEVDALNVFPVPDGDTGTNLAATAEAVVAELAVDTTPSHLVRSALRSARGNSGVIFSQVVRAMIEAIADAPTDTTDVAVLATGLERADALAREAVADPVEGTILTSIRAGAVVAREHADAGEADLGAVLKAVTDRVSASVRETRGQLEVLRDAGVVDAGARGFEVAMTALHGQMLGEDLTPAPLDRMVPRCVDGTLARDHVALHPFEVQYVLDAPAGLVDGLRTALAELGDSVVVVEADGFASAHVHTARPDDAVAAAEHLGGRPQEVRVVDLRTQVDADEATLSVVAVLPQGGLTDLGAGSGAALVAGAAGALPSVDDLLRAVAACPPGPVAILPGHPNVVPTARQAAGLLDEADGRHRALVVEACVHPLVVLSCLALGTSDPEELASAAKACRAGEVVGAVRDAQTPAGDVAAGQPIVVVDGEVVAIADDVSQALGSLLSALDAPSAELVTIAVGAEAGVDVVQVMLTVAEHAGQAEVDVVDGGQRPALLLAVAEG